MSDELSDRVKLQIEEILERADKPEIDVKAMLDRVSEILEERFPRFFEAIVLEALVEQLIKHNRSVSCKQFTGSTRCKKGKMVGEACLNCNDYKPARWFRRRK